MGISDKGFLLLIIRIKSILFPQISVTFFCYGHMRLPSSLSLFGDLEMILENLENYTGNSFRDLTRIAHINEDMWSELFVMNREALLRQMDLFTDQFARLREALATDDMETMKAMMRQSTVRRDAFDK